jgi:hypothetical protein
MTGRQIFFAAIITATLGAATGSPAFDVASVKLSKAPDAVMFFSGGMMDPSNGRMRVPNIGGNVNLTNWTLGGTNTDGKLTHWLTG